MNLFKSVFPSIVILVTLIAGCSVASAPGNPFIYVSTNGSDANNGKDPNYPMRTIQTAINQANDGSIIYVTAGTYVPGNGLNTGEYGVIISNKINISISGGWDLSFTSNAGTSLLNGKQSNDNVIYVKGSSSLDLCNFTVTGGTNTGIYLNGVNNSRLSSFTVTNNSGYYGGGIRLEGNNNRIFATITGNNASSHGGGIYLVCRDSVIDCVIMSNTSTYNGGGIYMNNSYFNTVSGVVAGNSSQYGGGVRAQESYSNTFNGTNSGNTAQYLGGGYYFLNIKYNTVSGPVFRNKANNGSGFYLENSYTNTVSGGVFSNIAYYAGGGLFFYKSSGNIITGTVSYNSNYGVNIETNFSVGNVFSLITNNYPGSITNSSAY